MNNRRLLAPEDREKESSLGFAFILFTLLRNSRHTRKAKCTSWGREERGRSSQPSSVDAPRSVCDFTLGFYTCMVGCARVRV